MNGIWKLTVDSVFVDSVAFCSLTLNSLRSSGALLLHTSQATYQKPTAFFQWALGPSNGARGSGSVSSPGRKNRSEAPLRYAKAPECQGSCCGGLGHAIRAPRGAVGQRWSLPRQLTRVLTLGILKAPPRARRASHSIESGLPKGPKSACARSSLQENR